VLKRVIAPFIANEPQLMLCICINPNSSKRHISIP